MIRKKKNYNFIVVKYKTGNKIKTHSIGPSASGQASDTDDVDDESDGESQLIMEIGEGTEAIFSVRSISVCQYDDRKLPVILS